MLTSRYACQARLHRGLVAHPLGALHLRWAGEGAPLVAMHESPRSSLSLLPLIEGLAARRTVIALDTPGYGHSDALPLERPDGRDFAAAFLAAFDALGLARASIYATHTGAALAVETALAQPARVAAMLLDGFAAFTPTERQDFLGRYLAPFEPRWDGAHIAELWSRCKDLFTWFPYHRREAATRLAQDPPPVAKLHDTVLGFLMAGAGYVKGYRCAATLDPQAVIAALRVPTTITARPGDLIHAHLDRVTPTGFARIRRIGDSVEQWLETVADATPGVGSIAAPGAVQRARTSGGWDRVLVELGAGYLHALDRGTGDEVDIVLPDIPDAALDLAARLGRTPRRTLVLDPPGCGASDPSRPGSGHAWQDAVAALRTAFDVLGVRRCRVLGIGFGAVLAARLAAEDPRVHVTAATGLPAWARGAAPVPAHDVVPTPTRDAEGAALFTSWYRVRDRFLYDDAGAAQPTQRSDRADPPDPAEVQARFAALWIAPECAALAASLQAHVRREPQWYRSLRCLGGELAPHALEQLDGAPAS